MKILREHALRRKLADEVHSRPYVLVRAPVLISQICALSDERGDELDREYVKALCLRLGHETPDSGHSHFICELDGFKLQWERHTEFSSYTIFEETAFEEPFASSPLRLLPANWVEQVPGEILVATHVAVEAADSRDRSIDERAALFSGNTITGGSLFGGLARAWTDHQIHDDGFGRILIRDGGLNQRGMGRLIRRILEIETYRFMAMMAYPLARDSIPLVAAAEKKLSEIVSCLPTISDVGEERELLAQLSVLAAEAEAISASTAYRISAARAYYTLVRRRIAELREERLEWLQPSGNFLTHRLAPAMETCENMDIRHETLSRRIARASNLLRTRVDVALEEQNRDLLDSMNRRAQLQLRLQETVEGLSVVAISYYLLSLISYFAKGAKSLGSTVDPFVIVTVLSPLVIALVWYGARRVRRSIARSSEGPGPKIKRF